MHQVMVIYASRHGSTRGIAQRVGDVLGAAGLRTTVVEAEEAPSPDAFDALVIGGAAYMGKWLEPVSRYIGRHRDAIAARPTWLYSSGPVGTETVDKQGVDVLTPPPFLVQAAADVGARGTRVFFGRWDPEDPPASLAERLFRLVPVSRDVLPIGDYRDWASIEAWAREIAASVLREDLQVQPEASATEAVATR